MSQQPPHDPRDEVRANEEDVVGNNPYYARQQEREAEPDLDAGAPELRTTESQRMNRKALFFLAAIAAVLMMFAFLVVRGIGGKEEKPRPKREETVVVPDIRPLPPVVEAPPPIPVQPQLPPMPQPPDPMPLPANLQDASESRGPSLLERRILASSAGDAGEYGHGHDAGAEMAGGIPGMPGTAQAKVERATSARFIQKPNALLARGTYIRCILESRIISDFGGFTSCMVTEPVYSINGRTLLLPKGSKILGTYQGGANRGARIEVIWDRITTPTGIDVSMSSPGVDNLGSAGVPGQYDAHWGSRIGAALLISMISDGFKYAAAENGPSSYSYGGGNIVVEQPYESATARTMERMANQAIDESMAQRRPTVTVNQGTIINVYVSRDVDFSGVVSLY